MSIVILLSHSACPAQMLQEKEHHQCKTNARNYKVFLVSLPNGLTENHRTSRQLILTNATNTECV